MGNANEAFNNALLIGHPLFSNALNRISEDVDMVTVRFNYRFGVFGIPKY